MNSKKKPTSEFESFQNALGQVLKMSHADLKAALAEEKKKAAKKQPKTSDRASREKD